jgi:acetyltransferase-like isoleucine patch superfamily enzyme
VNAERKLEWDWYEGTVPENVLVDETAYIETSFSFHLYRSEMPTGVKLGRGASTYLGTMFDVGPGGRVQLGDYTLVHGARIICDSEIFIGDYALISWNVVLMDSYRFSFDPDQRRNQLWALLTNREYPSSAEARPIRIDRNVWIGFEACVLPGVTIGEGAIVGARAVVHQDVAPFTIVGGNPAQFIREVPRDLKPHD